MHTYISGTLNGIVCRFNRIYTLLLIFIIYKHHKLLIQEIILFKIHKKYVKLLELHEP